MTYKFANSNPVYEGRCLNLSGSGIFFHANKQIEIGKALEVCVYPKNTVAAPFTAYVEVLRNDPAKIPGFGIAASIKAIKAV